MQLRTVLILIAGVGLVFGIFSHVRAVDLQSKDLRMVPLGYEYKGKPLTGVVYSVQGSQLASITLLWKGLRHGPDIQWYPNGQRFIERHYRYGHESGTHKAWYEDGRVKALKHFENGVPHGEFFDWHHNGQLAQFVVFNQGKEIAAKSWTGGGKPFYNYVYKDGQPMGLQGDRFCSPSKKQL